MAKKKTTTANPAPPTDPAAGGDDGGLTNDVATAADAAAAAKLDPSPVSPVRKVTSTFVDLLGSPKLQADLKRLEGQLKSFKSFSGQSVTTSLALANEGKKLTQIADRLDNSVARVHQRVVEINANLRAFQTALANCAEDAAPGSDVASALATLAHARHATLGMAKAVKTRNANARAKKPTPAT